MPDGSNPTFAAMADALLEQVRHDSRMDGLIEEFGLAPTYQWPGTQDALRRYRNRLRLIAEAQKQMQQMAPREQLHRWLDSALDMLSQWRA